jgi:SAM-dependent methyltransferase
MSKRVFDDFDPHAAVYREVHNECLKGSGGDSDHFSEQKVAIVRELETVAVDSILDLGCGDGNSAAFFRDAFPDADYVGIDTSTESIAIAEQRGLGSTQFLTFDGFNLPFNDDQFDVVFAACVLHHVARDHHHALLEEMHRVLKPGGRSYIFEHNPINPLTRRIVRNCPFDQDAVLLSSGYLRELLRSARFGDVTLDYTIFLPRHRIFRPLLGVERHLGWLPIGGQYFTRAVKPEEQT